MLVKSGLKCWRKHSLDKLESRQLFYDKEIANSQKRGSGRRVKIKKKEIKAALESLSRDASDNT